MVLDSAMMYSSMIRTVQYSTLYFFLFLLPSGSLSCLSAYVGRNRMHLAHTSNVSFALLPYNRVIESEGEKVKERMKIREN